MIGAEYLDCELGGQALYGIDVVAAGIEPVEGVPLGILVGEEVALGKLNCQGRIVLARDHLEIAALVGNLGHYAPGYSGIDRAYALERGQVGDERGVDSAGRSRRQVFRKR